MKKLRISFVTMLAVLAIQPAFGQAALSLGLKGGLNFANINTSNIGSAYASRTGYHVGAFVLVKFAKFGIQPEIIYSQQGSSVQFSGPNVDTNLSYLNIPVIAKLYLVGGFNLQVGPQFGFLMSATGPVLSSGGSVTTGDIKSSLTGSDISIGIGAGVDLPFGLNFDARYNLGVSDVNNQAGSAAAKNQVFQFSVGYKLIKKGI